MDNESKSKTDYKHIEEINFKVLSEEEIRANTLPLPNNNPLEFHKNFHTLQLWNKLTKNTHTSKCKDIFVKPKKDNIEVLKNLIDKELEKYKR